MSRSNLQPGLASQVGTLLTQHLREVPRRSSVVVRTLRTAVACILRGYLRTYHRIEIHGRENLPSDGSSFVMIANHSSHLDALCLLSALPLGSLDRAFPAAAEEYFFVSLPGVAAMAIFINAMPFGRTHHVRQSMNLCRQLLRERGNILILFPEGTRSATGKLSEFRPGIGSLLAGLNVPVVPCAIEGAHRAMPRGSFFPRPRRLRLTIGEPRAFAAMEPDRESARTITRQLHEHVQELLCA